jgi:hypothetical protein
MRSSQPPAVRINRPHDLKCGLRENLSLVGLPYAGTLSRFDSCAFSDVFWCNAAMVKTVGENPAYSPSLTLLLSSSGYSARPQRMLQSAVPSCLSNRVWCSRRTSRPLPTHWKCQGRSPLNSCKQKVYSGDQDIQRAGEPYGPIGRCSFG